MNQDHLLTRRIIGANIRKCRENHKWNRAYASGLAEMSEATLTRVELGLVYPSMPTLIAIASTFDKPIDYFINNVQTL